MKEKKDEIIWNKVKDILNAYSSIEISQFCTKRYRSKWRLSNNFLIKTTLEAL